MAAPKGNKTLSGEPKNEFDPEPVLNSMEFREALSLLGRMKKKQQMRRYKAKLLMTRKRAEARRAALPVIRRRARKRAIDIIKTRLAGGRDPHKLSPSEKSNLERRVTKARSLVDRLATRLIKDVKKIENKRLAAEYVPEVGQAIDETVGDIFPKFDLTLSEALDLHNLILEDIQNGLDEDKLLEKAKSSGIPYSELYEIWREAAERGDAYASAQVNAHIIRSSHDEPLMEAVHLCHAVLNNGKVKKIKVTASKKSEAINKVGVHLSRQGVHFDRIEHKGIAEEVELDELSKKKLNQYIDRADSDIRANGVAMARKKIEAKEEIELDEQERKAKNRKAGIVKAIGKLAK